jgi:predicted O-methyltransferase YrrM
LERSVIEANRGSVRWSDLPGLSGNHEKLLAVWQDFVSYADKFPFPKNKTEPFRYYYDNPFYAIGDGFFHFCMVNTLRPKRYIEIGSGFSSACFLDTVDYAGLQVNCTFIEPYPARLRGLLSGSDIVRREIIEQPVQRAGTTLYRELGVNDILFIDSTHVLKAGSDVAFELFTILPNLRSGVIVHFHDMFWPFEYPAGWIFEKQYSWNELYAVRAFLTFNPAFEIVFFNDYICAQHGDLIAATPLPDHLKILRRNCGGGLWLRRL